MADGMTSVISPVCPPTGFKQADPETFGILREAGKSTQSSIYSYCYRNYYSPNGLHPFNPVPIGQQSTAARQATCEAILDYIDQQISSEQ